MTKGRLDLSRAQVLAHRRRATGLDERVAPTATSLRRAAWAGLQDSMPRAALLSIHARVRGAGPLVWEHRSLVQVWGPRFSTYVVPARDHAVFTLGRMPDDPARVAAFDALADRIEAFLAGRQMDCREVGRGLGRHPVSLRYAAPTGRVAIRWDGARQPTIWALPKPRIEAVDARLELARRYLHVFGPGTVEGFAQWAGVKPPSARSTFDALAASLTPVAGPIGDGWILSADEPAFRRGRDGAPGPTRLLPSGDAFWLLHGRARELLVADARLRAQLWTPRVWPGAVLVDGEVVGTWRRAGAVVKVTAWRTLSRTARAEVVREATQFPLPDVQGSITVEWETERSTRARP